MSNFGGDFQERGFYEEAIKRHVCARCIDFGADGICHGEDPAGCALFRYLPQLVSIAKQIQEPKVEPYVHAVREHICRDCRNQSAGKCGLRDTVDCGLDRYLPLALDAIEEVRERMA